MSRKIPLLSMLLLSIIVLLSCVSKKPLELSTSTQTNDMHDYFIHAENLSDLHLDQFGNIYVISNHRNLLKYNPKGELEKTFDTQFNGFVHSIDVNNPLYIMLFYRDARRITLLDRNLSVLQEIDFTSWTTNDITAAHISNDNQIWLYDNIDRKLIKYRIDGSVLIESLDLYGLTSLNTMIDQIYEFENLVFLRNMEGKIIVVDNLGRYISDKNYETGLPLHGNNKQICFPNGKQYICLRLNDPINEVNPVENLQADCKEAVLHKFMLYQLFEGGIERSPIIF